MGGSDRDVEGESADEGGRGASFRLNSGLKGSLLSEDCLWIGLRDSLCREANTGTGGGFTTGRTKTCLGRIGHAWLR